MRAYAAFAGGFGGDLALLGLVRTSYPDVLVSFTARREFDELKAYAVVSWRPPDNVHLAGLAYPEVLLSHAADPPAERQMRTYAAAPHGTDDAQALADVKYPRALQSHEHRGKAGALLRQESTVPEEDDEVKSYAVISNNWGDQHGVLEKIDYPEVLASYEATVDARDLAYRPNLMIDSGAFSVWTLGRTVDLGEYIAWARELYDTWPAEVKIINLDVIPGTPSKLATKREKNKAIKQSIENAQAIRGAGLPVIEVWHKSEDVDVLDGILERRQPGETIGFGGLVGRVGGPKAKTNFCNAGFDRLRDFCGGWDKLIPVHGLGISGDAPLAKRYPWFSVDSSSWFTARNFNLHVQSDGKFKDRDRETSPRTTEPMSALFMRRRLERWLREAASMSELWHERGVRFLDDAPVAA